MQWQITTNRVGWASATVTFQYTDAEIAGLNESLLIIQQAPTAAWPLTDLSTTINTPRNEATVTVTGFSVFALTEGSVVPAELSVFEAQ